MPNWCHNRVSFYSDNEQDISKLRNIFESDEPFNTIVPSPDWKNTPNEKPGATYGELPRVREMKRPDGTVLKSEVLDHARMNTPGQGFYKVLAESALRAIRICQPLRVPPTGYEKWKDLQLNFDANEMLKG